MSKAENLEQLQPFKLPRAYDLGGRTEESLFRTILKRNRLSRTSLPSLNAENHPLSDDFRQLIDFSYNWIEENLGLSVFKLRPKDVHLFTWAEWKDFTRDDGWSLPYRIDGVAHSEEKEVFIFDRKRKYVKLHLLNHELIHIFSRAVLGHDVGKAHLEVVGTGFHNYRDHVFMMLNEATTELLNHEILRDYYQDYDGSPVSSYQHGRTVLIGFLMTVLARKQGISPQEARKKLYRAYLTNDFSFLRVIESTFGPGSLKYLSMYPVYEGSNKLDERKREFIHRFKIDLRYYQRFVRFFYEKDTRLNFFEIIEMKPKAGKLSSKIL